MIQRVLYFSGYISANSAGENFLISNRTLCIFPFYIWKIQFFFFQKTFLETRLNYLHSLFCEMYFTFSPLEKCRHPIELIRISLISPIPLQLTIMSDINYHIRHRYM